jgi:hypothetical protein
VARYAFRDIHPERPIVERAFGGGSVFAFRTISCEQRTAYFTAAGEELRDAVLRSAGKGRLARLQ